MPTTPSTTPTPAFAGLEPKLAEQLPTFELFFKTFGFKRLHGRIWGLLVLADRSLSSKEIASALEISQGSTSTTLNELAEWGAVRCIFDSSRRCHLHEPVGNTMSIVATVFRRREQVVMGKLRQTTNATLVYVRERYGDRDPRVLTLRSILSSCEIAEAVMQLVFTSVERALGDSQSLLSKAVQTALKVGLTVPSKFLGGGNRTMTAPASAEILAMLEEVEVDDMPSQLNDEDDHVEAQHDGDSNDVHNGVHDSESNGESNGDRNDNGEGEVARG